MVAGRRSRRSYTTRRFGACCIATFPPLCGSPISGRCLYCCRWSGRFCPAFSRAKQRVLRPFAGRSALQTREVRGAFSATNTDRLGLKTSVSGQSTGSNTSTKTEQKKTVFNGFFFARFCRVFAPGRACVCGILQKCATFLHFKLILFSAHFRACVCALFSSHVKYSLPTVFFLANRPFCRFLCL